MLATCVFNERQIKFIFRRHATPPDNNAFQSTRANLRTLNLPQTPNRKMADRALRARNVSYFKRRVGGRAARTADKRRVPSRCHGREQPDLSCSVVARPRRVYCQSNGDTGTLSGNGQTLGFDYLWRQPNHWHRVHLRCIDQYATYGDLSNLGLYRLDQSWRQHQRLDLHHRDPDIANQYANDPLTLVSYAPTSRATWAASR